MSGISHRSTQISSDMLFDMGSTGKNLFATLILNLAQEGLLSLDDSLHQYLPPFPHVDSTITIRQCLTHTSGLYMFVEHLQSPYQNLFNSNDFEKWGTMEERVIINWETLNEFAHWIQTLFSELKNNCC
ncbi:MAG: serine hydrolase [bacterium]